MAVRVDNVNPITGPVTGGTVVVITGDGFEAGATTTVKFGNRQAVVNAVTPPNTIQAVTPAHDPVSVSVRVRVRRKVGTLMNAFTFQPLAPNVTGVAPNTGSTLGGTVVTITGTSFNNGASVAIGGIVSPNVTFVGATTLTATVPAHAAGAVGITVTNPDGGAGHLNACFTYIAPPAVTAIDPASSRVTGGRSVTITGTGFVNGAVPTIGGVAVDPANMTFVNATTLTAIVPAHAAGAVDVTVTNPDGQSHTLAGSFRYTVEPAPSNNEVTFLMDGEEFFEEFRLQMNAVQAAAPAPLTYVRIAFWMIKPDVTLGDRTHYLVAADKLVEYIGNVISAGHTVDVIVWYPNFKDRRNYGDFARDHDNLAKALTRKDQAVPAGGLGRVRIYLERYEGYLASSNHQKMAIFSINGQRTVLMGGLNMANNYFDTDTHHYLNGQYWHDTAIRLIGPATDHVEAEWMRRWQRAVDMQAKKVTLNDLKNQVRARYVGVGSRNTIRRQAVAITPNRTPQPTPAGANATVQIATTRSVRSTRYRDLRDLLLARINAANNYVYMENNQFTDPEIVRALYQRKAAIPGLRIIIITNIRDGGEGYMTRRSWLQLVLRMPHPVCERVWYKSKMGGNIRFVDRLGAPVWNVIDSYNHNKPTKTSWLQDDALEIPRAAGGTKKVKFGRIIAVECDFHFYTTICNDTGHGKLAVPCLHSKLAVIDDRYLIVGSSNWTYRSMQYDGEIAAFIDSGPPPGPNLATTALAQLLSHYDEQTGLVLSNVHDNIEQTAEQNAQDYITINNWPVDDQYLLFPLVHHELEWGNVRKPPGKFSMPNYTWI